MARLEHLGRIAESDETSVREAAFLPFIRTSERSKHYPEARWLLAGAKRTLTDSQHADFEAALAERIDVPTHARLYQESHLDIDPQPRILEYLNDLTVDSIDTAESWVKNGALEVDAFASRCSGRPSRCTEVSRFRALHANPISSPTSASRNARCFRLLHLYACVIRPL